MQLTIEFNTWADLRSKLIQYANELGGEYVPGADRDPIEAMQEVTGVTSFMVGSGPITFDIGGGGGGGGGTVTHEQLREMCFKLKGEGKKTSHLIKKYGTNISDLTVDQLQLLHAELEAL